MAGKDITINMKNHNNIFMHIMLVALVLLMSSSVKANVLKDMQHFFNKFGSVGNTSSGSAFQDQSAGYMTGGSLFVRNPVRSQRVVSMTMPGYRAGCGGIDIWSGGFSYINGEGLNNMMQAILSNAPSYAVMLAIETYAPQIHSIVNELNKLAADFNRLNINSCETAALALGGLWPKSDTGSQAVCQMISAQDGSVADRVKARHECGVGNNRDSYLSRANRDMLVGEFNLAWKLLEKMEFLFESSGTNLDLLTPGEMSSQEEKLLKEIFMTLSGTIINKKMGRDGGYTQVTLASKANQEAFIKALMQGGSIQVYECDESQKCLNPRLVRKDLPSDEALQIKIERILESIVTKIRNDQGDLEISKGEISLINSSHLPVYKILNVTTAYQKGRAPINISQYGELIAFDVTYKYINDVLDAFQDASHHLKALQFTDEHVAPFMEGIRQSKIQLSLHRDSAFAKMDLLLGFIQKTQLIEKQIHTMMGSLSNEYGF